MKSSILKDTHIGNQPIRVLKHNITHRLESFLNNHLKILIEKENIKGYIKYHIADLSLSDNQKPYINDKGEINIHETYLSYIWIINFTFFVLYDEALAKPIQIKQNQPNIKDPDNELIDLSKGLFDYGKSLIVSFSKWDKEYFPNPEYFDENTNEGFYILRTNDLFVNTMNFILCHELAHAEFEHLKNIDANKLNLDQIKNLEREADNRAIELMLNSRKTVNNRAVELGILTGIVSILYFKSNLKGGPKHPDVDERLLNFLTILNPKNQDPIWGIACLCFNLWEKQFNLNISYKNYVEDFKEQFIHIYKQIKQTC